MRKLCVVSLVWASMMLLGTARNTCSVVALGADEVKQADSKAEKSESEDARAADHSGDSRDGDTPAVEHTDGGEAASANSADTPHDSEEHPSGVPLSFKADLAFWSLIVFLVFLLVLRVGAWQPLAAGLDQREASIRADIAGAEQARVQAEQMLADHAAKLDQVQDEVREILAEARRDAEHTKQDIIAEAQREAELTKDRSVAEIERARDAALRDVFDTLSEQVVVATEQVLSRALTDEDQKRFVGDALAQFADASGS
ncbi:MAG: ATP synthase F0 subunit B [Planctomycetaceae bacterium]